MHAHTPIQTILTLLLAIPLAALAQTSGVRVTTGNGVLEGTLSTDGQIRGFKGVPFAAPPVGPLRWQAPQAPYSWTGVRKAVDYAPRCMQAPIYSDMIFRDAGPSEDCLYLNIWAPAAPASTPLPVMVWIFGGGFQAGAPSEPRQEGDALARKGVIVVSLNYRLNVFGFLSHPELTRESGHNASGNYGLMDQMAGLQWLRANIAAFGGDPGNVTIFGESAGSFSVSALMASPLARGLFHRAIGESGAFFSDTTLPAKPRAETEKADLDFARTELGTTSLAELRAKSAAELMRAAAAQPGIRFSPNVDGYYLPEDVPTIFAKGQQAPVALLAGWNADEGSYRSVLEGDAPTVANLRIHAQRLFGTDADEFLRLYPATRDAQARRSARDLAGDTFIAHATWRWLEAHQKTARAPLYSYRFEQSLPLPADAPATAEPSAPHASEIEFVFQVLASKQLPWRAEDCKVSDLMAAYWTNFAKHGDPNGAGLPVWPQYAAKDAYPVMHLSADPHAAPDTQRARHQFLDRVK